MSNPVTIENCMCITSISYHYQKDDENYISLARPTSLLAMASEQNLQFSGKEIEDNLIKIIENVK